MAIPLSDFLSPYSLEDQPGRRSRVSDTTQTRSGTQTPRGVVRCVIYPNSRLTASSSRLTSWEDTSPPWSFPQGQHQGIRCALFFNYTYGSEEYRSATAWNARMCIQSTREWYENIVASEFLLGLMLTFAMKQPEFLSMRLPDHKPAFTLVVLRQTTTITSRRIWTSLTSTRRLEQWRACSAIGCHGSSISRARA